MKPRDRNHDEPPADGEQPDVLPQDGVIESAEDIDPAMAGSGSRQKDEFEGGIRPDRDRR